MHTLHGLRKSFEEIADKMDETQLRRLLLTVAKQVLIASNRKKSIRCIIQILNYTSNVAYTIVKNQHFYFCICVTSLTRCLHYS